MKFPYGRSSGFALVDKTDRIVYSASTLKEVLEKAAELQYPLIVIKFEEAN